MKDDNVNGEDGDDILSVDVDVFAKIEADDDVKVVTRVNVEVDVDVVVLLDAEVDAILEDDIDE